MVKRISKGDQGSNTQYFAKMNGFIYFAAGDKIHGVSYGKPMEPRMVQYFLKISIVAASV